MAVEHADDATKFGSSMSSYLPLLVFHHQPADDQAQDNEDEMLMFSISKQSLHRNMERGHVTTGNSSMYCWSTPQGWILLAQDHDTLPLPDIVEEEHQIPDHSKCLLSHKNPAHPGCVVVLFSRVAPELWYCHTATGDDNSSSRWRHCTYDVGNYPSIPKPQKGKKARRRRRPIKNKFSIHLVDLPEGLSSGTHWFVESHDQLFVVTIGFVDFNPNNIGAIEDSNMAASCPASALGLKANQIFFMKNFMDDDGDLCIFDLETNTQEIIQVHSREDLILFRKPFWIVPPS
ncbi:hypothetical protein SORBI_3005G005650 [Sorghum bicolor]|uniref:Uncharacterized protein n=1 Tax=Sorghum bicolor TaxID=4558 RepID=A0A1Z5RFZ0_SORBI|nr:hypothetical protein SORBI_3005G005650 [Sorghum bicolor]